MARKLLLISTSTTYGTGYLDHAENNIKALLGDRQKVVFVPFARPGGISWDGYTKTAKKKFNAMGYDLLGVHQGKTMLHELENAEAVFIGGGNTFVLLSALYDHGLMDLIRARVGEGLPYIGTSAGSNVAGSTMMTTNDMPIMYPPSFKAIGLVPFVINPHYIDPVPDSKHMGETRETRIKEYHVFNSTTVAGLREGSMLWVEGDRMLLKGENGARIFHKGKEPEEFKADDNLSFLLEG